MSEPAEAATPEDDDPAQVVPKPRARALGPPPRKLSLEARSRLELHPLGVVAAVLLLLGLLTFLPSEVVGVVEFALPTERVTGEVVEVRSMPFGIVETSARYEIHGRTHTSANYSDGRPYGVGDHVELDVQIDYLDHARIVGLRKYALSLTQGVAVPLAGLLSWVLVKLWRRRRLRVAREGRAVCARVIGERDRGRSVEFDLAIEEREAARGDYRAAEGARVRHLHVVVPKSPFLRRAFDVDVLELGGRRLVPLAFGLGPTESGALDLRSHDPAHPNTPETKQRDLLAAIQRAGPKVAFVIYGIFSFLLGLYFIVHWGFGSH